MRKLGSTDIGELEFQLTFYTGYTCKVVSQTDYVLDVTIINYETNRLLFVISLELTYDGLILDTFRNIHGLIYERDKTVNKVKKALETFNCLRGNNND